ncbi:MAG TPA: tetratricopeptide repeat protein [Thermomicrobiales bacterium]|nr:tetratricopeptide repeat protein [Thermomicrobiales bacterium]
MREFPSGTVTFLFTDVEGSTRRWEQDSTAMRAAIERHFAILDEAISAHRGVRFKIIGDAVQAAFPTALDAVLAAVAAQRALIAEDWGALGPIRVRMALHTGAATPHDNDYLSPALNRLARLLAAGAGGQILLTEATRQLVRELSSTELPLEVIDLGEHRLRDLNEAEHVFQLTAPGLPADFPPLKSLDRHTHNLPPQLTPFIGREALVKEIRTRLEQPAVRLLTLTGPGGAGKTRLALQVATELVGAYADGVWFVPLASVTSVTLVVASIAGVLGVRESSAEPLESSLRAYLKSRRLLLVLDNFEHVVDASPLVADLLSHCPDIQVLVTSRAPLHLSGEYELPIPPLELPSPERPLRLDDALASEAVRLFVDRARAVQNHFELTEDNAEAIVAICRRLDGLPLAIELAASRVRLLPPKAILARLDSRLALLTGGGRDLPERQQTLRGAIAWSHDLLDPALQTLFRRLAVFAGGWTLEAAEAVTDFDSDPPLPVFDGLDALHDTSLIRLQEPVDANAGADPRFVMLQTIQEFADEQLVASGELAQAKEAHASWFLELALTAEPHLPGPSAVSWLDRLESEHDNLRGALDWLRSQGDGDPAVALAAALWRFWWLRGHVAEGRERIESALAVVGSGASPARAAALDGAGVLAETQGDYDRAEALHRESLTISRDRGDKTGIARALGNLGVVAFDRGDDDHAMALLEESLGLAREIGDHLLVATALHDLGLVAHERGELDRAELLYQESLALRRQAGSGSEIARSLNNLAGVAVARDDFDRACQLFAESLSLYNAAGDRWGAAGAQIGLAVATHLQGDASRAVALLEESRLLFREVGDRRNAAVAALNLADALRDSGDLAESIVQYRDALVEFAETGEPQGIAQVFLGLGGVMARVGEFEVAARLLAAASVLKSHEESGSREKFREVTNLNAAISVIRGALGEGAFTAAWEAGRAL